MSFQSQVQKLEHQLQEVNTELAAIASKLSFYGSEKSKVKQNTKLNDALQQMKVLFPGMAERCLRVNRRVSDNRK